MLRLIGLLAVFLLAGCDIPQPPLRLGTNVWIGYEPLYLARSLDLFANEDVRLLEYTSASQVMSAIEAGRIDAGALTLDETLLLLQQGIDIKIILIMDMSNGGDALLGRSELGDLKAIKGKTIGFENGALGAYMLHRILEKAELQPQDIHTMPIEVNKHEDYFLSGKIDAVVTFEPVISHLQKAGAKVLLDSSQLPGEIVDVLVVRSEVGRKALPQLKRLIAAWFAALDYIRHNPDQAAQRIAPRLKLDSPEVLKVLKGVILPDQAQNRENLLGSTAPILSQAERLNRVMRQNDLIKSYPEINRLLDPVLLDTLYPGI